MITKYDNYSLNETIINPNFSIVVPSGCNGNCSFCFWKESKVCENYIGNLTETLNSMPSQFYQLSLTGGEPSLSPYLEDILENIDRNKWKHTVLTTNGTNILKFIPKLKGVIDHINISRHHYIDELNENVFDTNTVPNSNKLRQIVKELHNVGIDVTFSAVLTENLSTKEDIEKYIKYANSFGVKQVFFRKEHGTLDPSEVEKAFEHLPASHHFCPVCRNTTQTINGTTVVWKASVEEPSKDLGMIYEVVYNENGKLTSDWEQNNELKPQLIKENSNIILESCGGGGSSGCGGYSSSPVSYSSCGSSSYSSCGSGGYSSSYEEQEETEEEKRRRLLANRKKKIKKIKKRLTPRDLKSRPEIKSDDTDDEIYTEFEFDDDPYESLITKFDDFLNEGKRLSVRDFTNYEDEDEFADYLRKYDKKDQKTNRKLKDRPEMDDDLSDDEIENFDDELDGDWYPEYSNPYENLIVSFDDFLYESIDNVTKNKDGTITYRGEDFPGFNKPKKYTGKGKYKKRVLAKEGDKIKVLNYGHSDYEDYTQHKDKERRKNFRARHNCDPISNLSKLTRQYWACQDLW